jgi:hypothetical protein
MEGTELMPGHRSSVRPLSNSSKLQTLYENTHTFFLAEALLLAVDKATSNTLFQPDWEVNRVCVEGMNLIGKPEV